MRVKDWKELFNDLPDDLQFAEFNARGEFFTEVRKIMSVDGVLQLYLR
jgi:hypothetical protein